MKVYFGFTVAGDRSSLDGARRMVAVMESLGHEVLTRHLVSDQAAEMDRQVTPQAIFGRDMNWLAEADIFIAEVSGSSFGIGYEAGYVLGSSQKQCVLFYRQELAKRVSLLIVGNQHPRCRLVPYSQADEMEAELRTILESDSSAGRLQ